MKFLNILTFLFLVVALSSCGSDDDPKSPVCINMNCANAPGAAQNIIGTWTTYNDDDESRGMVEFRADGTGTADENNPFSLFWGNTGETFTDFNWSYSTTEGQFLIDFGIIGQFFELTELDCDYMKLEDVSSITNDPDGIFYRLCRQ